MKTYLVRGVPASIQQDGWWMDGLELRHPPNQYRRAAKPHWAIPVLLALAILGVSLTLQSDAGRQQIRPGGPLGIQGTEFPFPDGQMLRSLPAVPN